MRVLRSERERFVLLGAILVKVTLEAFEDRFRDLVGLRDPASEAPQREAPNVFGSVVDGQFRVVAGAKIIDVDVDEVLEAELDFIDGRDGFTIAFLGHGFLLKRRNGGTEATGGNDSGF